jgi:catechol 2,3-dioxygenase-like lactoylglutathione lyase family enzyme
MNVNAPTVWPVLTYTDARAAIAFLVEAFGFEERAAYARDDDPGIVEHAELRWPLGGGVMLGTTGKDDSAFGRRRPGVARRGLWVARLLGPRPRGQPVELRDVLRRVRRHQSSNATGSKLEKSSAASGT